VNWSRIRAENALEGIEHILCWQDMDRILSHSKLRGTTDVSQLIIIGIGVQVAYGPRGRIDRGLYSSLPT